MDDQMANKRDGKYDKIISNECTGTGVILYSVLFDSLFLMIRTTRVAGI
jgi:hypothetical protein